MYLAFLTNAVITAAMLMPGMESDPFEGACTGILNMFAFGNSSCQGLEVWEVTPCFCPDTRYVQSVLYCINHMVPEIAKVPEDERNTTLQTSYLWFLQDCSQYTMKDVEAFTANTTYLEPYDDSDRIGVEPRKWPVQRAFSLSTTDMQDAFNAQEKSDSVEDWNKRFGIGLVVYWAGVILIKSVFHIFANVFPLHHIKLFNKKVPSLLRRQLVIRSSASLNEIGASTMQVAIMIGFWILMLIFTFAALPTYMPSFVYSFNTSNMWGATIGERSGVLLMYCIPLLILFAGRNNILQFFTGWPLNTFLFFHKWVSRAVFVLLFTHAVAYSVQRGAKGKYGYEWTQAYWNWGVVGIIFAAFVFVQSLRFLRRRAYDLFVVLHIIGVVIFLVGGYIHLDKLGNIYGLYFYWASFAVWGFDRALRLLRTVTSGIKANARIEMFKDTMVVTVAQPPHWNLLNWPGKYMFIHFWHPSIFWQSHPFTIYVNPENHNELKLLCKVHNGATRQIARKVIEEAEPFGKEMTEKSLPVSLDMRPALDLPVLLDGPYGHSFDLVEFDECVLIAGGTGVTFPFSYIQSSLLKHPSATQKFSFHWAVRDIAQAEAMFEKELRFLRNNTRCAEVRLYGNENGRLDIEGVIRESIEYSMGPLCVVCCGPASMCLDTRTAITNNMIHTENYVEYHEELFNW